MNRVEVAVGAVVERDDAILLVLRGRGAGAGQWSLPGGRVEFDETLTDATAREVFEETGLAVTVGEFLGWVERRGDDPEPYHYVILDFRAIPVDPLAQPVAGDDAADVEWVVRHALAEHDLVPGLLDFLRDVGVVPSDGVHKGRESRR